MEKITNIEIKNFKSIRHQTIEGCKRINVFVGPPNVGKSNILEALSLYAIDRNTDFSNYVRVENLTTFFYDGEAEDKAEIRVNKKHRIIGKLDRNGIHVQEQFERDGTSFEKKDTGNIFTDDSTDVLVKRGYSIVVGTANAKGVINYSESSIGRANELQVIKRYDFHKKLFYTPSYVSELSQPYGENIFSIISGNAKLRVEVQKLFEPYNLELLYDSREQKFTIFKRTRTGIFTIPYELVADTLQRLVFFKAAISSNRSAILLFEEPESHMYEPYILEFTNAIKNDININQFFVVTHSQYVIDELLRDEESRKDTNVYLVGLENNETKIKLMSPQKSKDVYQTGLNIFFNYQSLWDEN